MAVLLLAEMNGAELSLDATAKAVTAAKSLGDVIVLCASSGCDGAASTASQIEGVSKVLCADDDAYGNGLAEPTADEVTLPRAALESEQITRGALPKARSEKRCSMCDTRLEAV